MSSLPLYLYISYIYIYIYIYILVWFSVCGGSNRALRDNHVPLLCLGAPAIAQQSYKLYREADIGISV